jgi:hypothetical protein
MQALEHVLRNYENGNRICVFNGNQSGDGILTMLRCMAIMPMDTELCDVYRIETREFSREDIDFCDEVEYMICIGCVPDWETDDVYYMGPVCNLPYSHKYERSHSTMVDMANDIIPHNRGLVVSRVLYMIVERIEREFLTDEYDWVWADILDKMGELLFIWMRCRTIGELFDNICVDDLDMRFAFDDIGAKISDLLAFRLAPEAYISILDNGIE